MTKPISLRPYSPVTNNPGVVHKLLVDPRFTKEFKAQVGERSPIYARRKSESAPQLARKPKNLWLTPSELSRPPSLFLDVSENGERVNYYAVPNEMADSAPHDINTNQLEFLAEIETMGLMYPELTVFKQLPNDVASRLNTLNSQQRRYTRFSGITTDWDNGVDTGVWTTNADTVIFLHHLEQIGFFTQASADKVHSLLEVGVGGGGVASAMANTLPNLTDITVTDILLSALRCACRNINYYRRDNQQVTAFLGKGITNIPGRYHVMLVNPPYIPIHPKARCVEDDPYRGTGLIREIMEHGLDHADRIIMQVSSVALGDIADYASQFGRLVTTRATSKLIPLKIGGMNRDWYQWLVDAGRLMHMDDDKYYYPYWHNLHMVEIT